MTFTEAVLWLVNFLTGFAFILFIATIIFCKHHKRRKLFWLRFIPCALLYNALPFIIPDAYTSQYISIEWFSFSYIIFVALMFGMVYLCFDLKPINALFYVSSAYALQNVAYHLLRFAIRFISRAMPMAIYSYMRFNVETPAWIFWVYMATTLITHISALTAFYFLVRRMHTTFDGKCRIQVIIASVVILSVVYILDMWSRMRGYLNVAVDIYAMVMGCLLIAVQMGIFQQSRIEREREILNELLKLEHRQHQLSDDNITLLNVKFHDLKHQLELLRTSKGQENNILEIENTIGIYDSFVKTGNEVLDLILTEKTLLCKRKGIRIGIIADGSAVNFIDSADMSAMFGNILNNAIEAVDEVDVSKRIISLSVTRKKNFLTVHEDNWCEQPLTFKDGLPVTTKDDYAFHGYGTKSIKLIADKYGGIVSMSCEGNRFNLDVMIPLPM